MANLGDVKHADIGKIRPVLIFQNNNLNRMISDNLYDDVVVIPLSSQMKYSDFTFILKKRNKLKKDSVVLCHAIKMISSKRIIQDEGVLSVLDEQELVEVERLVLKVLDIS